MSWITDIFSSSVGTVIDSVGKIVDNLHTSDDEKLNAKAELLKLQTEFELKTKTSADITMSNIDQSLSFVYDGSYWVNI